MRYDDFKKLAEKKNYIMLSDYEITKSYVVSKFEIWMNNGDTIIAQILRNGEVEIFKSVENI